MYDWYAWTGTWFEHGFTLALRQGIALPLPLLTFLRKSGVISRPKEADVRARHDAARELLTDEHKLYRLAFAESNADRL